MITSGFSVSEETRPGAFRSFYWAAEQAEAEQHADCIRAIFPDKNIVVTPTEYIASAAPTS